MVSPFIGQIRRQLTTISSGQTGKGVHIWSYFPDPARSISYIPTVAISDSTTYLHILPMQGRVLCKYVYMYANVSAGSANISLALYKLGPDPIAYDRLPSTTDDLKIHDYSWLRITDVVVEEVSTISPSLIRFKFSSELTLDPEAGVYAVAFKSNRLGFGTLNLGSQLGHPEIVGSTPINTITYDNQETIAGLSMSITSQLDSKISLTGKVETAPVAYPFIMLASELGDKALPF